MGDRDHSSVREFLIDQSLDFLLGDNVDVGGGFIQDDYTWWPQNSSANTDQLTLPWWQILATFSDFHLESLNISVHQIVKLSLVQNLFDSLVWADTVRVQIEP